jgi:hypothetical protein
MKKIALILLSLLVIIVLAILLVPFIFKDDIQQAIQTELDNTLDADLLFDSQQFSVSLIKDFPNISVGIGDVGLTGKGVFEGDTLFYASQFDLTLDLMSVISGEEIKISKIDASDPLINILVTETGEANYDIVKETSDDTPEATTPDDSPLKIAMDGWVISNGTIRYIDDSLPYYLTLAGVDHQGSGTYIGDVFTMDSRTEVQSFSTGYDGIEYISDKTIDGEVTMEMDLETFKFTFKENQVNLNGLSFSFDGWLAMPSSDIDMDLTFEGTDVNLKSFLSLTPGDYQSYLEGVTAGGNVSFSGYARGTYNDQLMPAVNLSFGVNDGTIAYEPYPIPMENINIDATFDMPGADLSLASFVMRRYEMQVDGEQLTASLIFKDFDNYQWDFKMAGNADMEKITKIIPLGDMTLKGRISAGLATAGKMADLENEAYDKLPTSGTLEVKDFLYQSEDLPQGFGIQNMSATFDPEQISLAEFKGNAGQTDLQLSGVIKNYLGFVMSDEELLEGQLRFVSTKIDIDEWMVDTNEEPSVSEEDTSSLEVIRIPTNIDFVLASRIDQLLYDDLDIKDFNGQLIIRDGAILMDNVGFNLLDGLFEMNGSYDSKPDLPLYSYDLAIKDLAIPAAFQSFNTVQKLAPFAEKMNGKFSTNFAIGGALDQAMMPVYETIFGEGLIKVAQASLSDVKLMSAVSNVTSLKDSDGTVTLKDVLLNAKIEDGKVTVEPFDIKLGGYTTTISGGNSIEGALDYNMKVQSVPTGGAGQAVSSAISSLTGTSALSLDKVDINLGVAGTFLNPKVGLLGVSPAGSNQTISAKEQVQNLAKEKVSEKKEEVVKQVGAAKTEAVDSAKAVVNKQKEAVKETATEEVDKAKDKAKNAVKGLLKKKKGGGK